MAPRIPSRSLARAAALPLLLALGACRAEGGSLPQQDAALAVPAPGGMVDLEPLGYDLGDPDAPVTVVEFSDFGCPYCARFALETFPVLLHEYVQSGLVRWKYVPFALGIFPNGGEAALAAECAGEQGSFWAMHDILYLRQAEWKASRTPRELFRALATQAGVDADRFSACYDTSARGARTEANNAAAETLQVRGTPSFLINGQPVQGALPLEQFRYVLEQAGAVR